MDEPRTDVIPATLEQVDALIAGDDAFSDRFGLRVEPGYMEMTEALHHTRRELANGAAAEWGSHLVIDPHEQAVIGFGGYKGPPDNGAVEIGYAVAPAYRGHGRATSVALQLIARARTAGVERVIAHTLAEPNASTRVLQRCGMRKTAELADPQVGPIWRWELELGRPGHRSAIVGVQPGDHPAD